MIFECEAETGLVYSGRDFQIGLSRFIFKFGEVWVINFVHNCFTRFSCCKLSFYFSDFAFVVQILCHFLFLL